MDNRYGSAQGRVERGNRHERRSRWMSLATTTFLGILASRSFRSPQMGPAILTEIGCHRLRAGWYGPDHRLERNGRMGQRRGRVAASSAATTATGRSTGLRPRFGAAHLLPGRRHPPHGGDPRADTVPHLA